MMSYLPVHYVVVMCCSVKPPDPSRHRNVLGRSRGASFGRSCGTCECAWHRWILDVTCLRRSLWKTRQVLSRLRRLSLTLMPDCCKGVAHVLP